MPVILTSEEADWDDQGSKPPQANSVQDPISKKKKNLSQKSSSGVA
jgi:hypothetical protein